jgi:import receptor subunit TOM20
MNKFLAISGVVATAVVGYAVYFDYSRRNSPEFRRKLKKRSLKQRKETEKKQTESKKLELETIKQALLADLAANPLPTDLSEKETFFMQQVSLGEQIAAKAGSKVEAAICFYKALAVYPNPTDILGIYQRSIPQEVYEVVVMMIAVQPPAAITNILGKEPEPVKVEEDLD